jgi:hypothetical protein
LVKPNSRIDGVVGLAMAWAVLGVGMALGLYDSAFATLAGLYGRAARGPITGITLIAGFASTIGWPLSAFLDAILGWRGTCLTWAALHLLIGLPLNRLLIPRAAPPERTAEPEVSTPASPRGTMAILAFVFAATWFVTGAMAAHMPHLLEISGATSTAAIAAAHRHDVGERGQPRFRASRRVFWPMSLRAGLARLASAAASASMCAAPAFSAALSTAR